MTNLKGSLVPQTAADVIAAVQKIAHCDFRTGIYAYTTTTDELTWVGFAQHGDGHRFFTIHDAGKEMPIIRVLSKDQSMMHMSGEIGEVDVTDIDYDLTLNELTADSFKSVMRLLGLDHMAAESQRIRKKADIAKITG